MNMRTKVDHPDVEEGIHYPCSDGEPMAETQFHILTIRWLLQALEDYFANRPDVFVAGNIFWYWEQGNPRACRSPDAMVVFGVDKELRRSFRSWKEGDAIPRVCFEIASQNTWQDDLGPIFEDYQAAGVREYFIFDPTREYLEVPLLGFSLRGGEYQPMRTGPDGSIRSRQLGLNLVPEGLMLRLVDAKTHERVLTPTEQADAQRVLVAQERSRAEDERERANAERQRADTELARAEELAAELERLKAEMKTQGKSKNGKH